MKTNVGVSDCSPGKDSICPWKRRRILNENVLDTDKSHRYVFNHDDDINNILNSYPKPLQMKNFNTIAQKIVMKVVFNEEHIEDSLFTSLKEANSLDPFYNDNFKINDTYRK
jgi:hypothetical protein